MQGRRTQTNTDVRPQTLTASFKIRLIRMYRRTCFDYSCVPQKSRDWLEEEQNMTYTAITIKCLKLHGHRTNPSLSLTFLRPRASFFKEELVDSHLSTQALLINPTASTFLLLSHHFDTPRFEERRRAITFLSSTGARGRAYVAWLVGPWIPGQGKRVTVKTDPPPHPPRRTWRGNVGLRGSHVMKKPQHSPSWPVDKWVRRQRHSKGFKGTVHSKIRKQNCL